MVQLQAWLPLSFESPVEFLLDTSYDDAMSKQKQKEKHKVNKGMAAMVIFMALIVGIALFLVGNIIAKKIAEQKQVEQKRLALGQTLVDISKLYNDFAVSINGPKELTRQPENKCSENSGKGTPYYTCGTRAEIRIQNASEASLRASLDTLKSNIDAQTFEVIDEKEYRELGYNNALSGGLTVTHKKTLQKCNISTTLYREIEHFTTSLNTVIYSFNCNISMGPNQIFELEDYDQ